MFRYLRERLFLNNVLITTYLGIYTVLLKFEQHVWLSLSFTLFVTFLWHKSNSGVMIPRRVELVTNFDWYILTFSKLKSQHYIWKAFNNVGVRNNTRYYQYTIYCMWKEFGRRRNRTQLNLQKNKRILFLSCYNYFSFKAITRQQI